MVKISAEEVLRAAPDRVGSFSCRLPDGREARVQVYGMASDRGKLVVVNRCASPRGRGVYTFTVRCAVTERKVHGAANRRHAAKMLREQGWSYDAGRGGWLAPGV